MHTKYKNKSILFKLFYLNIRKKLKLHKPNKNQKEVLPYMLLNFIFSSLKLI